MYDVCDPIFHERDEFMTATGFDKVEHSTVKHGMYGLYYSLAAANQGTDITKVL